MEVDAVPLYLSSYVLAINMPNSLLFWLVYKIKQAEKAKTLLYRRIFLQDLARLHVS